MREAVHEMKEEVGELEDDEIPTGRFLSFANHHQVLERGRAAQGGLADRAPQRDHGGRKTTAHRAPAGCRFLAAEANSSLARETKAGLRTRSRGNRGRR